jgi:hypothetical protein
MYDDKILFLIIAYLREKYTYYRKKYTYYREKTGGIDILCAFISCLPEYISITSLALSEK